MPFMRRRFRSYRGRPWWWWRRYADRVDGLGSSTPTPPEGFVFVIHNGEYVTRDGAYLIKAAA